MRASARKQGTRRLDLTWVPLRYCRQRRPSHISKPYGGVPGLNQAGEASQTGLVWTPAALSSEKARRQAERAALETPSSSANTEGMWYAGAAAPASQTHTPILTHVNILIKPSLWARTPRHRLGAVQGWIPPTWQISTKPLEANQSILGGAP